MKNMKMISLLLVMALMLTMLGGCFRITKKTTDDGEGTTATKPGKETTQPNQTTDGNSTTTKPGETYAEGFELTEFMDAYTNSKQPLWDKMSTAIEEGADFMALSALLGMSFADLMILDVYYFDSIDAMGGLIMFTAIDNAYRRTKGDIIEFGYDYVYSEDKSDDNYPAGSHLTCTGTYNMATGRIHKESVDDKGSGNVTRTVIEINKLADDSYVSQFITSSDDSEEGETLAYLTFFKGTDIWSAYGTKTEGVNFTYNSIYERNVSSIDDMTAGFKIESLVSYVGDKITFESADE